MKRLFVALLLLVLCAPVFASAQANDETLQAIHDMFKDASDEELIALRNVLDVEIAYRGIQSEKTSANEVRVPVGNYIIGIDIPAGVYTVTHDGNALSMITIYGANGGMVTMYTVYDGAPIGRCVLEEQQSIEIVGEPVVFSIYEGLDF